MLNFWKFTSYCNLKPVGHGGSSVGSYLTDPTSPIPSHCASIVTTNTLRVIEINTHTRIWAKHIRHNAFRTEQTMYTHLHHAHDVWAKWKVSSFLWAEHNVLSLIRAEHNVLYLIRAEHNVLSLIRSRTQYPLIDKNRTHLYSHWYFGVV